MGYLDKLIERLNRKPKKSVFERALDKTFISLIVIFGSLDALIILICFIFDL